TLDERPGREVDVRVAEPGQNAAAAEIDAVGRHERGLVRAHAAGDPVARDRQRAGDGQRRFEGADGAVFEDHGPESCLADREEEIMLDHVAIPVSDFETSREFYERALKPLGAQTMMEFPGVVLLGTDDGMVAVRQSDQVTPMHIAFRTDRASEQAFYAAAMAAGASYHGSPGL